MSAEFPSKLEPEDSLGLLLWQVTCQWQRLQRDTLAPFDLTHVQFVLLANLAWLARSGAPVSQRALADHARVDVMMTSQVVRTLEKKGLVRRADHPGDARAFALEPTASGQAVLARAMPAVEGADDRFFARVRSKAGLADALRRLAAEEE